jgi:hypothetical protein
MARCAEGHESETDDFCDVCGAQIGGNVPAAVPAPPASSGSASAEPCPLCGSPREGRFCENDGYDFLLRAGGEDAAVPPPPPPPPPVERPTDGWALTVTADQDHYRRMAALAAPGETAEYRFPAFLPARTFALAGERTLIGRHSRTRGLTPEVDLSGPPEDPGVSHAQAMVLVQPDGTVAVVDLDSSNGTYVNGGTEAIPSMTPVPLSAGDRIHVGLWTTLTLGRATSA